MPVEASDIVQTVMDTGDSSSTGCEEAGTGSDDRVRKMTVNERAYAIPTKSTVATLKASEEAVEITIKIQTTACKDGQIDMNAFSATSESPALENAKTKLPAIYIPDAHQHRSVPD